MSIKEVWQQWRASKDFRLFYNSLLSEHEFGAFFWEHPPYHPSSKDNAYEFVLVDSPSLSRVRPELSPFKEHFTKKESVVSFSNLGGDARLLVPCPVEDEQGDGVHYAHLAAFVRNSPEEQMHTFWNKLGKLCLNHLGGRHKYLSTAGMGVYWLHVRLDERPKYYRFHPYRKA